MPLSEVSTRVMYISVISIIAVIITIYDKLASKHKLRRVPEATLLFISLLGGSVAMLIIMLLIHHKTRHIKFMAGIPIILLFQLGLVLLISKYLI